MKLRIKQYFPFMSYHNLSFLAIKKNNTLQRSQVNILKELLHINVSMRQHKFSAWERERVYCSQSVLVLGLCNVIL